MDHEGAEEAAVEAVPPRPRLEALVAGVDIEAEVPRGVFAQVADEGLGGRRVQGDDGSDDGSAEKKPKRTISDAERGEQLPGTTVRSEGDEPVEDASVNRAYAGLGATFELYLSVFSRFSIDGAGMPLDATVHYGRNYGNAFWDGERMVFGDGDGEIFRDFTLPVDVIGHELTHGVTQHTANLAYFGQSGALNESLSDVFVLLGILMLVVGLVLVGYALMLRQRDQSVPAE